MLSDHERQSLQGIEAHLAATDPGFARGFAVSLPASTSSPPRHSLLVWGIATCVVLLALLTVGLALALLLCTGRAVGWVVCKPAAGAAATPDEGGRR
jgi:hypothetical protein